MAVYRSLFTLHMISWQNVYMRDVVQVFLIWFEHLIGVPYGDVIATTIMVRTTRMLMMMTMMRSTLLFESDELI